MAQTSSPAVHPRSVAPADDLLCRAKTVERLQALPAEREPSRLPDRTGAWPAVKRSFFAAALLSPASAWAQQDAPTDPSERGRFTYDFVRQFADNSDVASAEMKLKITDFDASCDVYEIVVKIDDVKKDDLESDAMYQRLRGGIDRAFDQKVRCYLRLREQILTSLPFSSGK